MNRTNLTRDLLCLAAGALAGAGAMYWLDPAQGRDRRGAVRALLGGQREPMRPQALARAVGPRAQRSAQDDGRLRDRVRARLGTLATHPGAIDVQVDQSVVRLSGHVLAKELDGLLFQLRDVAGVHRIVNALTAHGTPEDLVAAQGSGTLRRRRVQPA